MLHHCQYYCYMFNRELGVKAGAFARRCSSERNSSIAVNSIGGQKCRDAPPVASVSRRPSADRDTVGGEGRVPASVGGEERRRGVPIHFRLRGREAATRRQWQHYR